MYELVTEENIQMVKAICPDAEVDIIKRVLMESSTTTVAINRILDGPVTFNSSPVTPSAPFLLNLALDESSDDDFFPAFSRNHANIDANQEGLPTIHPFNVNHYHDSQYDDELVKSIIDYEQDQRKSSSYTPIYKNKRLATSNESLSSDFDTSPRHQQPVYRSTYINDNNNSNNNNNNSSNELMNLNTSSGRGDDVFKTPMKASSSSKTLSSSQNTTPFLLSDSSPVITPNYHHVYKATALNRKGTFDNSNNCKNPNSNNNNIKSSNNNKTSNTNNNTNSNTNQKVNNNGDVTSRSMIIDLDSPFKTPLKQNNAVPKKRAFPSTLSPSSPSPSPSPSPYSHSTPSIYSSNLNSIVSTPSSISKSIPRTKATSTPKPTSASTSLPISSPIPSPSPLSTLSTLSVCNKVKETTIKEEVYYVISSDDDDDDVYNTTTTTTTTSGSSAITVVSNSDNNEKVCFVGKSNTSKKNAWTKKTTTTSAAAPATPTITLSSSQNLSTSHIEDVVDDFGFGFGSFDDDDDDHHHQRRNVDDDADVDEDFCLEKNDDVDTSMNIVFDIDGDDDEYDDDSNNYSNVTNDNNTSTMKTTCDKDTKYNDNGKCKSSSSPITTTHVNDVSVVQFDDADDSFVTYMDYDEVFSLSGGESHIDKEDGHINRKFSLSQEKKKDNDDSFVHYLNPRESTPITDKSKSLKRSNSSLFAISPSTPLQQTTGSGFSRQKFPESPALSSSSAILGGGRPMLCRSSPKNVAESPIIAQSTYYSPVANKDLDKTKTMGGGAKVKSFEAFKKNNSAAVTAAIESAAATLMLSTTTTTTTGRAKAKGARTTTTLGTSKVKNIIEGVDDDMKIQRKRLAEMSAEDRKRLKLKEKEDKAIMRQQVKELKDRDKRIESFLKKTEKEFTRKQLQPELLTKMMCQIDLDLMTSNKRQDLIEDLTTLGVGKDIVKQPIEGTVTWIKNKATCDLEALRKCRVDNKASLPPNVIVEENVCCGLICKIFSGTEFSVLLSSQVFESTIERIKVDSPNQRLILFIENLDAIIAQQKAHERRVFRAKALNQKVKEKEFSVNETVIKNALLWLELKANVQFWLTKDEKHTGEIIVGYTKSIASKEKNAFDRRFNFHTEGFKKQVLCKDIFTSQLHTLTSVSERAAKAIVERFKNYAALFRECNAIGNKDGIVNMIANIKIIYPDKGTTKRVGPAIGDRIYNALFSNGGE